LTAEDSSLKAGAPNEEAGPVELVSALRRLIVLIISGCSHLNVLRGGRKKGMRCEIDVHYYYNDGQVG